MNTILILKIFLTSTITWLISSKALKAQDTGLLSLLTGPTIFEKILSALVMVSFIVMFVTVLMLIWGIK
jgi:hypothetical protein